MSFLPARIWFCKALCVLNILYYLYVSDFLMSEVTIVNYGCVGGHGLNHSFFLSSHFFFSPYTLISLSSFLSLSLSLSLWMNCGNINYFDVSSKDLRWDWKFSQVSPSFCGVQYQGHLCCYNNTACFGCVNKLPSWGIYISIKCWSIFCEAKKKNGSVWWVKSSLPLEDCGRKVKCWSYQPRKKNNIAKRFSIDFLDKEWIRKERINFFELWGCFRPACFKKKKERGIKLLSLLMKKNLTGAKNVLCLVRVVPPNVTFP